MDCVCLNREWRISVIGAGKSGHGDFNTNEMVEREAFNDSVRVNRGELKDTFLFKVFMAFCVSLV